MKTIAILSILLALGKSSVIQTLDHANNIHYVRVPKAPTGSFQRSHVPYAPPPHHVPIYPTARPRCEIPVALHHATPVRHLEVGQSMSCACPDYPGYNMHGPRLTTCAPGGVWSPPDPAYCIDPHGTSLAPRVTINFNNNANNHQSPMGGYHTPYNPYMVPHHPSPMLSAMHGHPQVKPIIIQMPAQRPVVPQHTHTQRRSSGSSGASAALFYLLGRQMGSTGLLNFLAANPSTFSFNQAIGVAAGGGGGGIGGGVGTGGGFGGGAGGGTAVGVGTISGIIGKK